MRTFVYGTRIVENEQQIKFVRRVRLFGNCVGMIVKFFAAFIFFIVLNAILTNFAQHTGQLFTLNAYRVIQEGLRVLIVDNAFSTSSIIYQDLFAIVSALAAVAVTEYGLVVNLFGNYAPASAGNEKQSHKREQRVQTVNAHSIVSYKQKVCFLS